MTHAARSGRLLRPIALLAALISPGCWYHVDDHCPGCTVIAERAADVPRFAPDRRAAVILVHGAFGFGSEWAPVIGSLQQRRLEFVAWSWPGPWPSPPRSTARFAAALQGTLDTLPPSVNELVLIGHSAGGGLVENAVRRVRVPAGRRLRVLSIAPARVNYSSARDRRFSNDALAQTMVVEQNPLGPIPPGAIVEQYLTEDPHPLPVEPRLHRIFLGRGVSHNESVGRAALPVIEALAAGE